MPQPASSRSPALGLQVHVAHDRWRGAIAHKGDGTRHGAVALKPAAFWTSTETDAWESAWTALCREDCPVGVRWPPAVVLRLEVVGEPRVLRVGGEHDLWDALFAHAPRTSIWHEGEEVHDPCVFPLRGEAFFCEHFEHGYNVLAQHYDAVHFCGAAGAPAGDAIAESWECESVAWLRPGPFLRIVGERRLAEDGPESADELADLPAFRF